MFAGINEKQKIKLYIVTTIYTYKEGTNENILKVKFYFKFLYIFPLKS